MVGFDAVWIPFFRRGAWRQWVKPALLTLWSQEPLQRPAFRGDAVSVAKTAEGLECRLSGRWRAESWSALNPLNPSPPQRLRGHRQKSVPFPYFRPASPLNLFRRLYLPGPPTRVASFPHPEAWSSAPSESPRTGFNTC